MWLSVSLADGLAAVMANVGSRHVGIVAVSGRLSRWRSKSTSSAVDAVVTASVTNPDLA